MRENTDLQLLTLAKEFADAHSNFDATFIESLEESFNQHDRLSIKQRSALENIISKWEMVSWGEDNL